MYPKSKKGSQRDSLEEDDENLYSKKSRERLVADGALNYEEDGFMQGYEEDFPNLFDEEEDDELSWIDERYPEEVV